MGQGVPHPAPERRGDEDLERIYTRSSLLLDVRMPTGQTLASVGGAPLACGTKAPCVRIQITRGDEPSTAAGGLYGRSSIAGQRAGLPRAVGRAIPGERMMAGANVELERAPGGRWSRERRVALALVLVGFIVAVALSPLRHGSRMFFWNARQLPAALRGLPQVLCQGWKAVVLQTQQEEGPERSPMDLEEDVRDGWTGCHGGCRVAGGWRGRSCSVNGRASCTGVASA
jgi:hypothetical protein